jgi:hypothetical protein
VPDPLLGVHRKEIKLSLFNGDFTAKRFKGDCAGEASIVVREIDKTVQIIDEDLDAEAHVSVFSLARDPALDTIRLSHTNPTRHGLGELQSKTFQVSHDNLLHSRPFPAGLLILSLSQLLGKRDSPFK